jgi:hypothetical protein
VKQPPARPRKVNEIEKLSLWPEILRADVQTYGAEAVNRAGLRVLGYPALLALEESEAAKIREVLKKE